MMYNVLMSTIEQLKTFSPIYLPIWRTWWKIWKIILFNALFISDCAIENIVQPRALTFALRMRHFFFEIYVPEELD